METWAEIQKRLHDGESGSGWGDTTFGEECAHIHEEVSEAFREWRLHKDARIRHTEVGKPTGVPIELADVVIGCFFNAEEMGFDLMAAVEMKHRYNLTRDYQAEGRQLHVQSKVED